MDRQPDVIVIRGAPGVGKSSTAKCLAGSFPGGARVEVDILRKMVISVNWKKQDEHILMLDVAARLVHDLAESGFRPVIVVDTFSGDKVTRFLEILRKQRETRTFLVFSLHASETSLQQRLHERPSDEFKDFEIAKKLNEDIHRFPASSEWLIDNSRLSPDETARHITHTIVSQPVDLGADGNYQPVEEAPALTRRIGTPSG